MGYTQEVKNNDKKLIDTECCQLNAQKSDSFIVGAQENHPCLPTLY